MKENESLEKFLVKKFIMILAEVVVSEYILLTMIDNYVIPVLQREIFGNRKWDDSLSVAEISLWLVFLLVQLVILGVQSVLPKFLSGICANILTQIESLQKFLLPVLSENESFSELKADQVLFLFLVVIAMVILMVIPCLLAAFRFSSVTLKEVQKIQNRRELEKKEYDRKRNLMLSDIAHDLRTPITTIAGYATALSDGMIQDDEKRDEYLKAIYSKSVRMNDLITLLFEYVKLDSEGFELNRKAIDLSELVRENVALAYSDIEAHEMELEMIVPDEQVWVYGDPLQISRVITNLINNAIRHNEAGTVIGVEMNVTEDEVILAVADNGSAIEEAVSRHLFEPFAVGDRSRTTKGGTGLGLSIAKKVITMHGWDLRLQQGYPGYTKAFIITLDVE